MADTRSTTGFGEAFRIAAAVLLFLLAPLYVDIPKRVEAGEHRGFPGVASTLVVLCVSLTAIWYAIVEPFTGVLLCALSAVLIARRVLAASDVPPRMRYLGRAFTTGGIGRISMVEVLVGGMTVGLGVLAWLASLVSTELGRIVLHASGALAIAFVLLAWVVAREEVKVARGELSYFPEARRVFDHLVRTSDSDFSRSDFNLESVSPFRAVIRPVPARLASAIATATLIDDLNIKLGEVRPGWMVDPTSDHAAVVLVSTSADEQRRRAGLIESEGLLGGMFVELDASRSEATHLPVNARELLDAAIQATPGESLFAFPARQKAAVQDEAPTPRQLRIGEDAQW